MSKKNPLSRFIFSKLQDFLAKKNLYLINSLAYRNHQQALPVNLDYVRYSTLGLCYEEIKRNKVGGNIAELGVYKGEFAKRLNALFPEKKLYLFDTFEGFDERDITSEQKNKFSQGDQDFSDTSVELVLSKMKTPEQCIVRKGFFPETATGIEDTFCFVSIDTDLYEPIIAGLNFFYPRLEHGGYIFVHDYNNDGYKGSKEAVLNFCKEQKIGCVPLSDTCGTVVITR